MTQAHTLLSDAVAALDEIIRLVARGRAEFDGSEDRQRALAYCWIAAGSALKDYARLSGVAPGEPPLSLPIRFRDRLAHQALHLLDTNLLWEVSSRHSSDLQAVVGLLGGTQE